MAGRCSPQPSLSVLPKLGLKYMTRQNYFSNVAQSSKASSINDVTALRGGVSRIVWQQYTKALVLKSVTMGKGGVKNFQKLYDIIYGRPLTTRVIVVVTL